MSTWRGPRSLRRLCASALRTTWWRSSPTTTGTSSIIGDGAFGDFMIFEQRGTIACSQLADLTRYLIANDLDSAYDLCEPFDDETEVRRG